MSSIGRKRTDGLTIPTSAFGQKRTFDIYHMKQKRPAGFRWPWSAFRPDYYFGAAPDLTSRESWRPVCLLSRLP